MVLAHFDPERPSSTGGTDLSPLAYAVSKALMAVQQILLLTHLHSLSRSQISDAGTATPRPLHHPVASSAVIPTDNELDSMETRAGDPKRKAKRMKLRELRIIPERRRLTAEGEGWPGKKLDWESLLQ
jgi:pyridoxine kinase